MKSEQERHDIAEAASSHLPKPTGTIHISSDDEAAMRTAFQKRFGEDLPRTETMYAVAAIGYRMALRDYGVGK